MNRPAWSFRALREYVETGDGLAKQRFERAAGSFIRRNWRLRPPDPEFEQFLASKNPEHPITTETQYPAGLVVFVNSRVGVNDWKWFRIEIKEVER